MDIVTDYDAPPNIQKSTEESRDHVLGRLGAIIERLGDFPDVQAEYVKVMRQQKRNPRKPAPLSFLSAALGRALSGLRK